MVAAESSCSSRTREQTTAFNVRRAACQTAQNRSIQAANIFPKSGDECAPPIGGLDLKRGFVLQRDYGQIADIQRTGHIAAAVWIQHTDDVEFRGCRHR
jgi:hypothetical protein